MSPSPVTHRTAQHSTVLELTPPPPTSLTLHPSPAAALLKTPSKTYSLRQKNTSNALILLMPTVTSDAAPGLSAIATVHETIELVPEAEAAAEAAPKPRGKWHEKFGRGR